MDWLRQLADLLLHVDRELLTLAAQYGTWLYGILFVIIFCETGLVVTPFLPGDSLLFAAGALCAAQTQDGQTPLSLSVLLPLLIVAAIFGDAVNFAMGRIVGPGILEKEKIPLIKKAHLIRAQLFYEKHGGKAIVLARFVPIVRTFAPFVAGIGKMNYRRFAMFNVVGAVAWVVICAGAGFLFGNLPIVKNNFERVVLAIILISVLPLVFEYVKSQKLARAARTGT